MKIYIVLRFFKNKMWCNNIDIEMYIIREVKDFGGLWIIVFWEWWESGGEEK